MTVAACATPQPKAPVVELVVPTVEEAHHGRRSGPDPIVLCFAGTFQPDRVCVAAPRPAGATEIAPDAPGAREWTAISQTLALDLPPKCPGTSANEIFGEDGAGALHDHETAATAYIHSIAMFDGPRDQGEWLTTQRARQGIVLSRLADELEACTTDRGFSTG
jgi:hypothetical protein